MTQHKEIVGVVLLATLFIAGVALSQHFSEDMIRYLDFGVWGMVVYVFAGITATVLAPISTLPLVPFAVRLWGPLAAALLSILAWGVGSLIAFVLARHYGKPLVRHFVDLEKAERYEKALTRDYIFWNVVFLRMAVPADILSYAIGLFSGMPFRAYTLATFIGITPFAFIFAYAAVASLIFQVAAGLVVLGAIYLGYQKVKNLNNV